MSSFSKYSIFLLVMLSFNYTNAQDFLQKKELITFNFSDTVTVGKSKVESIEQVKLYLKSLSDFSKKKKDYTKSEVEDKWEVKCSFEVSKSGLIGKQINGKIHYNLHLIIEENIVQYKFTNFRFQPYQRNRYGRFAPKNNVYYPLAIHWSGESLYTWEQHQLYTKERIERNIAVLNSLLKEESIAAEK